MEAESGGDHEGALELAAWPLSCNDTLRSFPLQLTTINSFFWLGRIKYVLTIIYHLRLGIGFKAAGDEAMGVLEKTCKHTKILRVSLKHT